MPKLKILNEVWEYYLIKIPHRKENIKMLDSTDVMIRLYDIAAEEDVSIAELCLCAQSQGYIEA